MAFIHVSKNLSFVFQISGWCISAVRRFVPVFFYEDWIYID